jgi:CBS domain-containing protein
MMIQAILDRKGSTVFTIQPTATVRSAIDQMHKRGVAALVVEGATGVQGLVSERNVVSAISQYGERAITMTVKDIFTQTSISVAPEDSIKKAMSLMTIQRLRQLPVIADGRLVGIISIGDVVKHRLEDLETESTILRDLYVAVR